MKNRCFFILIFLVFAGCQTNKKSALDLEDFLPEDPTIVIKTKSLETLADVVNSNHLAKELSKTQNLQKVKKSTQLFSHLKPKNNCLISFSEDNKDSLEICFISHFDPSLSTWDSITNVTVETVNKNNLKYSKIGFDNTFFFSGIKDSIYVLSNKRSHIESVLSNDMSKRSSADLFKISKSNTSASIFLKDQHQNTFSELFPKSNTTLSFTNETILDVDLNQNDVVFNGITKANDSSLSLINVFKNSMPQENLIASITPSDADYFLSLSFNDIEQFKKQLRLHQGKPDNGNELVGFETFTEIGMINFESEQLLVFRSIDPSAAREAFSQSLHSEYRSVPIYEHENPAIFKDLFAPFFSAEEISYYTNIDDFFVFSNNTSSLATIISNFQNRTTLNNSDNFKKIMQHMSDESSMFVYSNPKGLDSLFQVNYAFESNLDLNPYKASAIQYVYETNFAHVNGILKTSKSNRKMNSVSEDLNISIESQILGDIQLTKNHRNNQQDIVIQDVDNNLYLISNKGKVFWKKQLDGPVLGKIEQMDMYKNGRLQLVFATQKKIYVLDRNGNEVAPFPLKFNDKITQPLSVFDYDKKRNYRLMLTQGSEVLMYDQRGKLVNGFKYRNAQNTIESQPKHFRIGRKDYIVFKDGTRMEILNRVGKRRVDVKESISFSDNEIYLYKNQFTTTSTTGELLEVNQNGIVNHTNLNLNESHDLTTTSKTLVTLSENRLSIKSKTVDLEFGDYTAPQIFYINDKIYVSVTDKQSKKVFLFDSQARPIRNFPVYGTSAIAMANIDKDKAVELLVKGDDNTVIVYEIN